jgi:hypothetical protein
VRRPIAEPAVTQQLPSLAAANYVTDRTEPANAGPIGTLAEESAPLIADRPTSADLSPTLRVTDSSPQLKPYESTRGTGTEAPGGEAAAQNKEHADPPHSVADPGAWQKKLAESLELLEAEVARTPADSADVGRLAAMVRLLHVVANHPQQAVAGIDPLSEDEREYWKHQSHALLLALDADQKNAASRRFALTLREMRSAADHLANLSALDVRNVALCDDVDGYGQFSEFRSQSFRPGAPVLLYVEIDNFSVAVVGDKFETELQGSYEIVDEQGNRVTNVVLPLDKQLGSNRRRDYFITYEIHLPKDLSPGRYELRLTMEDVKGRKSNQGSASFRIRN